MWNRLKENLPKHWNTTRIENRYGGGIPDVHICADGFSFWVELKVTKTNRIAISSHQVGWNYAYYRSGGVSFYLVTPLLSPHLYLFGGDQGPDLIKGGMSAARGSRFSNPAALFESLRPRLLDHYSAALRPCDPAA